MASNCNADRNAILATSESFEKWLTEKNQAISTNQGLDTVNSNITGVKGCLTEKLTNQRSSSTETPQNMDAILALQEQIKKKEEEILIAKDRAAFAREGSKNPSYYESWFPLGRPLKPLTTLFFIGLSIFLLLIAAFFAASLAGFTFTVLYPAPRVAYTGRPTLLSRLFAVFPTSFWVLLAIGIGLFYYLFKVRGSGTQEKTA